MKIKWGNKNDSLTITADNSYDKLFLSIIEKQVCDRGVYVISIQSRLSDAQKKMHEKCNKVVELETLLKERSLRGRIYKLLGLGDWNW
jgi:hypothetical protein